MNWQEYIAWDLEKGISAGLEEFPEKEVLLLGLVGAVTESAEALDVAKKLKWHHHPYSLDRLAHILEEMGDEDWYRSIILRWLPLCFTALKDWTPQQVQELLIKLNQMKLEARYSEGWTAEQSIERSKELDIAETVRELIHQHREEVLDQARRTGNHAI